MAAWLAMATVDGEPMDSRHDPAPDVCVIGAGPAGLAVALRAAAQGREVILADSGLRGHGPGADLNGGRIVSAFAAPDRSDDELVAGSGLFDTDYLESSRWRDLGGAAHRWGVRPRPDDVTRVRMVRAHQLDFAARPDFGVPGWPVAGDIVSAYYDQAADFTRLGGVSFDGADHDDGTAPYPLDSTVWGHHAFHFPPSSTLHTDRVAEVTAHDGIDVRPGWTAVGIATRAGRVESVTFAVEGSDSVTVRPQLVILAGGGVENSRFLLNAREQHSLEDPHDQLGRWYMDHPHLRVGFLDPADGIEAAAHYDFATIDGRPVLRGHDLAPTVAHTLGLLRFSVTLVGRSADDATASGAALSHLWDAARGQVPRLSALRQAPRLARHPRTTVRLMRRGARPGTVHNTAHGGWSDPAARLHEVDVLGIETMFEQRPSPDNRIRLGRTRDRLGHRTAELQWSWSQPEITSVRRSVDLVRDALEPFGRVTCMRELGLDPVQRAATGYHQLGGTRMSTDPADGSVDPDGRYWGLDNLYVAGSSVFPSSVGFANPTLTLIATSLRLADHICGAAPASGAGAGAGQVPGSS